MSCDHTNCKTKHCPNCGVKIPIDQIEKLRALCLHKVDQAALWDRHGELHEWQPMLEALDKLIERDRNSQAFMEIHSPPKFDAEGATNLKPEGGHSTMAKSIGAMIENPGGGISCPGA